MSLQARRDQVGFLIGHGISKRRACGLIGVSRSGMSYESRIDAKDKPVIEAMRRLSGHQPRGFNDHLPTGSNRLKRRPRALLPARRQADVA